jgi:flagellar biosynthesis/type III secretory pathway protein FliH
MMDLPRDMELQFDEEIRRYQEEMKMPYISSIERLALERGLEQGREEGREQGREQGAAIGLREGIALALEIKFGSSASELAAAVEKIEDLALLRTLHQTMRSAATVDELRKLLDR